MGAAPTKEREMGIMDFVKGGAREMMIVRPDDAKQLLIYKHSDPIVPLYSQIIVDNEESALFFKDGKHVGSLLPGRHTLDPQNTPFLNQFMTSSTGGATFVADIFFVKLSQVRGVTYGGPLMVMEDPVLAEYVTPQAFGEFSFQVVDPARFVIGCRSQVGGSMIHDHVLKWVKAKFSLSLQATMSELCSKWQKSLLHLNGMTIEICARTQQRAPHLEEIGVTAVDVILADVRFSSDDALVLRNANKDRGAARRAGWIPKEALSARQAELDKQFQQELLQKLNGNSDNNAAGSAMTSAKQPLPPDPKAIPPHMQAPAAAPGSPASVPPVAGGKVTCSKCHASVPVGKFCTECGTPLSTAPAKKFCATCGVEIGSAKFCANCGTPAT